ncbi:MAG: hypothetical protein J6Z49_06195 [Kiritimatiellae bacterium]|nr:hypothetical protein [Kiritimatiellia bacterium]
MAEKPEMQYTIRQQANRATGGYLYVPSIVSRDESIPLETIVERAIDRGLIVAIKTNAAKSVADGVARQMLEEFRQGNGVKFGDYFYARLYLDGTTDGNGTLVEGRNGINVRLYKGEGFKLSLNDFSWHFAEAANIPTVDYAISDADGAQRGILIPDEDILVNGTQLYAEDDDGQKLVFTEVLPEGSTDAPEVVEVTRFISRGPNLLSCAWPNLTKDAYRLQAQRIRGTQTFVSNHRGVGVARGE